MSPRSDRQQVIEAIHDPFVRRAVRGAYHVRRYMPFYVLGLVWALSLAVFPSVNERVGGDDDQVGLAADGGEGGGDAGGAVDSAGAPAGGDGSVAAGSDGVAAGSTDLGAGGGPGSSSAGGIGGTGSGSGAGRAGSTRTGATAGGIVAQTGKTKAGLNCTAGVRQLPVSSYAIPCRPAFVGDNGGATFRGVTKDKIKIIRRVYPDGANAQAVDQVNQSAGFASRDTEKQVRLTWIPFLNKYYELYGRTVDWEEWQSPNGNSTDEAQSKNREGACADATKVVQEVKAFAVASAGGSSPFSECAAERKLMVTSAAAYFPDDFYRKRSPYLSHVLMDCERIAHQLAEYTGKRLAFGKAKWAGDPLLQAKQRKIGIYVPDNDGYQRCTDIAVRESVNKYKTPKPERFNYQLDVSRFPDQAAQAIVQFKAAGVTTVNLSCDYISVIFLTQAAKNQNYEPEWQTIGTAATDTDNSARLYDQETVNGHLFGLSQLGATTKVVGSKSEAGRLYKFLTGKEIPAGTTGNLYDLIHLFNLLQVSGPTLTPQNIVANMKSIPPGGAPDFAYGYWSLAQGSDGTDGAGDFTEVDDAREVYYVSEPGTETAGGCCVAKDPYFNGPDGKNGTYKESYGGKRFRNGEWPSEEPQIYPKR